MNHGDRSKVRRAACADFLWQQCDQGIVEAIQAPGVALLECLHHLHDFLSDDWPCCFIECPGEAIQPGSSVARHLLDCGPDVIFGKGCVLVAESSSLVLDN